ncbi:MAG: energy-coupling factor ABC transporter ATP-binding protein [Bryobacteraceae bacterium]
MPSVFEVRSVTYRYEQITALDSISLDIEEGQRVALVGANGSGKSTLLRLLDGLYFPETGAIRFRDELLSEARLEEEQFSFAFRRRVGLVFQNPDVQLFNPTVFDEIAFGPLQLRWPKEAIRDRVARTLDSMGILSLKDRPPHRLSGGEKKRVALASVLVLDPEVLLLDEPTSALDPRSKSHVIDLLAGWKGAGKTVVTATHDLDTVEDIADTCYVFQSGRVVAHGPPATILGDTPLLERTGLLHAHRHVHASGEVHSHPHRHGEHQS